LILGHDEFIKTNLAKLDLPENLAEYSRAERRQPARPIVWYFANASTRNDGIVMAYTSGRYTMKEIGDSIELGYSMVSRIIKNSRFKA
jgi:putative transposase